MAARHNWGMYHRAFGAWEAAYGGCYVIEEAMKAPPFPGFENRTIITPFGEVMIAKDAHPWDVTKWVKISEGKYFSPCGKRKTRMEERTVETTHMTLGATMWDDDTEWTTSSTIDVMVDDGEVTANDLGNWGINLDQEFNALEQKIAVLMADYNRHRYGRPFVHRSEFEPLRLAAIEEACASTSVDAGSILNLLATKEEKDRWQEAPASTPKPAGTTKPVAIKGKVTTIADCDRPESPFAALKGKIKKE